MGQPREQCGAAQCLQCLKSFRVRRLSTDVYMGAGCYCGDRGDTYGKAWGKCDH